MLGNDHKTNTKTIAIARQQPARQWTGWKAAFSMQSVLGSKQDKVYILVVGYSPDGKDVRRGHSPDPLPANN
jgi:hypothetical protein